MNASCDVQANFPETSSSSPRSDVSSLPGVSSLIVTETCQLADADAFERLSLQLDCQRGLILSCGVDIPGRYHKHRVGLVNPPIALTVRQRELVIKALNGRGQCLLPLFARLLGTSPNQSTEIRVRVPKPQPYQGAEELRTRRPSVFSLLRRLMDGLRTTDHPYLGFYGAFGYDLAFALETIPLHHSRPANQRDLVLYFPDRVLVQAQDQGPVEDIRYDFQCDGRSTEGLARDGAYAAPMMKAGANSAGAAVSSDHASGAYADQVRRAKDLFARGDLFELVLSQTLSKPTDAPPSTLFKRLTTANPAPYQALINLGNGEHLVSASPEMFVRVSQEKAPKGHRTPERPVGLQVETCPISGTIARGATALEDADAVQTLLNSAKDHAELTMCTDVDRNDKARVCQPGSVRVIGRRQLEFYSRLIHTVDHVVGRLRPDMDALDGFLSHTWAVTVTGSPKLHAMRRVEAMEQGPRRWYGGAFGVLRLDGTMDTGLTLRTVRLAEGLAEVRVGATLLHDSDPDEEQKECLLKASALLAALQDCPTAAAATSPDPDALMPEELMAKGAGKRVLLVDHEDSFVLTLADYLRQAGAVVTTLRPDAARSVLAGKDQDFDLVVLSPGPGKPEDFKVAETLRLAMDRNVSVFGVCLGLQGIVEGLGGTLRQLATPFHGRASLLRHDGKGIFHHVPPQIRVGRYHSLVADRVPDCLEVCASTGEGTVMAVRHRTLPIQAVQFHPESLLSATGGHGLTMIRAVLASCAAS